MRHRRFVVDRPGATVVGDHWDGIDPVVVFLHAAVTDRRSWAITIAALDGQLSAATYDRRGFGETPPSRSQWSQVDDLWAVVDHVDTRSPVWLVGGSAGGGIELEAAYREPGRVAGLVLLDSAVPGAPFEPSDTASAKLRDAIETAETDGDLEQVNRLEFRLWLDGPGQPEGRVGGDARDLIAMTNRIALENDAIGVAPDPPEAVWERLADVTQTVLVLCGDLDLPHIRLRSEGLAASLSNGRYETLVGVVHRPQVERPGVLAQRILAEVHRGDKTVRVP